MGKVKKHLLSKIFKGMMAFLFVFTVFLGQVQTASAAVVESTDPDAPANVSITKELKVGDGVKVRNVIGFSFTAMLMSVRDHDSSDAEYSGVSMIGKMIWIEPDSQKNASGNYVVDSNGFLDGVKDSYPHAGEYVYSVRESNSSDVGVTYSLAEYTMKVYVKNSANGPYISAVTVEQILDQETGAPISAVKVDPGDKPDDGTGNGFRFINTYLRTTDLKVSNTVVGDYADLTKDFNYKLVMDKANVVDGTPNYAGTIYNADGTPVSGGTVSIIADGTTENAFSLKHGQYLVIEEVASGSTYRITQDGEENYTPAVVVTENAVAGSSQGDVTGNPLATGTKKIGDGANIADFKNTYVEPSITGIIMNNLPFILMIGLGIAGIIGFFVIRRRRASRS